MNERQIVRETYDHATTLATVIRTIEGLVQDWEIDEPIDARTKVVADLGFESVDLIQMIGALEESFRAHRLSLVDMLVVDGRYVDDLSIAQIADGVSMRLRQKLGMVG